MSDCEDERMVEPVLPFRSDSSIPDRSCWSPGLLFVFSLGGMKPPCRLDPCLIGASVDFWKPPLLSSFAKSQPVSWPCARSSRKRGGGNGGGAGSERAFGIGMEDLEEKDVGDVRVAG